VSKLLKLYWYFRAEDSDSDSHSDENSLVFSLRILYDGELGGTLVNFNHVWMVYVIK